MPHHRSSSPALTRRQSASLATCARATCARATRALATLSFATLALVSACTTREAAPLVDSGNVVPTGTRVDLTGAGATFPYPLYSRWFNEYAQRTNVRINYQSIGSGGGIRQMLAGTVDFGATDVPMTDQELAQASAPILHIPTVLGAVAIT